MKIPRINALVASLVVVAVLIGDGFGQSASLLLRTEGEMDSMTQRIGAIGGLSEEQSRRLAFLLREYRDAISLFAKHGLLSDEELQTKINEIIKLADLQIGLILSPTQMTAFESVTKRPIRRRIIRPIAVQ